MQQQVVTFILKDGTPTGILECSIDEWFGISYKIPRNKLREASLLKCINNTGIYILFGDDPNTAEKIAYIGETENIYERLNRHNREKDFWNYAIVFMSENNSLNKAHIKYIEYELYQLAVLANRFSIRNDKTPTRSSLGSADEIRALKFIERVKVITSLMSYRLFDYIVSDNHDSNLLYLKINGILYAKGLMTDEGFVVLKDSKLKNEISSSISKSLVNFCERERSSKDIVDGLFINDHLYSSPSMAAVVVLGRNSNGYNEWKNEKGVSLKQICNRD